MARLRSELRSSRLIPGITAGILAGAIVVVLALSFAALIFTGPLERHLPAGIGLALLGGLVTLFVLAVTSGFPATVGGVQDTTAALMGLMAAGIAASVPAERDLLDVALAIALTSVLAGVFFLVLGTLRLGNLVRYMPYPVVGGFLAGTGLLLVRGGVGILTGESLTLRSLDDMFVSDTTVRWLPGVAFAVLLLVSVRRSRRPLVFPGVIALATIAFYTVLLATGTSLSEARADGWLLGPYPEGGLWRPWAWDALGDASWGAILSQAGSAATVLLVGVIALLLNVSGIELASSRDLDLNRELRAAGAANVVLGLGGGMIGFHTLSLSLLADRVGARNRLPGLVAAAVVLVALVVGASVVTVVPTPVIGGVVVFLGLGFLVEWTVDAWSRLPRIDYVVVLMILLAIGFFGFLAGVGLGLALAVGLFVVDYSRTENVKHAVTAAELRSKVDRHPGSEDVLRTQGARVQIFELQGFMFFGTANSLLERIRARVLDRSLPPLRALVLDFRRVGGIDSSAVLGFRKVQQLAEAEGFDLVLTSVRPKPRRQLEHGGLAEGTLARLRYMNDLDRGLQWSEDRLIGESRVEATVREPFWQRLASELPDRDADRLRRYLEPVEIPAGHVLIRQGDRPDDVYLLEDGALTAQMEDHDGPAVRLRTMGPGTVVGEVGLYTGGPRTASIVSEGPSRLLRLSRRSLEAMEREDPELASALHRMFARSLAARLTDTLQTIDALLD
ncbi:MAG TPA: SulP family inorganic anion transporter [Actinomycetota bacterium]|nr:SulP family inorganic anion transporter [Actinomycetota bacterium]